MNTSNATVNFDVSAQHNTLTWKWSWPCHGVIRYGPRWNKKLGKRDHIIVQRLFSSAVCEFACWNLLDSDGLYVNSEVSSPYFSLILALHASFLLGRWSTVPEAGNPVAGLAADLLSNGCRTCCLGLMNSSSLSYSAGLFAALTIRANRKRRACKI